VKFELPDSVAGEVADAANESITFILTDASKLTRHLVTQLCTEQIHSYFNNSNNELIILLVAPTYNVSKKKWIITCFRQIFIAFKTFFHCRPNA